MGVMIAVKVPISNILLLKSLRSKRFFLKEMNTFILRDCIKLIKIISKDLL